MTTEAFRSFVREAFSPKADFDTGCGFGLHMSYETYLAESRKIVKRLGDQLGEQYIGDYDFNLKKGMFYPASFF